MNNIQLDIQSIMQKADLAKTKYWRQNFGARDILDQCDKIKLNLIEDFLYHPVTKEILAGPTSSNSSGTLGGYGNLFSFIGFEKDQKPIDDILNLLNPIKFNYFFSKKTELTIYVENYPTLEDIWNATPMPWSDGGGRSWAKGIESGISGLNYYVNFERELTSKASRSGYGLELNSEKFRKALPNRQTDQGSTSFRLRRYTPTSYITTLFQGYRTRLNKLLSPTNRIPLFKLAGLLKK